MTPHTTTRRFATLALGALVLAGSTSWAQTYPTKPITMVVPFGPGSGTDQTARMYGQAVSEFLQVPVVVENKGGAAGFLAAQQVAKSAPDGYTIFMTTNTTQVANPFLFKKVPYDPVKDFAPIALLSTGQMLLLVRPDAPYRSVADLLAAAQKAPGKLNFGSGSSSSQVAGELLKQLAKVDITNVPYKSNPQAIIDLIGGQLDFMFADATTAIPQVEGGKLRALAVSGSQRMQTLPDLPTVAQAGLAGYDMTYWIAVYAPASTPAPVVERLSQAFGHAAQSPEVRTFQLKNSSEPAFIGPQALAQFQAQEMQKWERVIRAAGLQPQ